MRSLFRSLDFLRASRSDKQRPQHLARVACAFAALSLCAAASRAARLEAPWGGLIRRAQTAAAAPFQPNESKLPQSLRELTYDSYRKITFRREQSLWHSERLPFEAQFFHPGYLFQQPVAVNEVTGGTVQPLPFGSKYFRYPDFDRSVLSRHTDLGFAGVRILYPINRPGRMDEVISFLGSNYFRALGKGETYGISARAVAIDTAEGLTEEFPSWKEFWLCRPDARARQVQLFALLDGPSVSGAYRFIVRPGEETTVEIEAHLFFRRRVQVLGIAPLSSMFWRGENDAPLAADRRPEVHDSDTLLIETADRKAENHPLTATSKVLTQTFPAPDVRAFGLLQRDRAPAHYRDREAKYERRPSVRIESLGKWGEGSVRLMQLPANNEYNDNVTLVWQPQNPPAPGAERVFKYRLHWFTDHLE